LLNINRTELDPHVRRVIDWRESLVKLPDKPFFELIRMYLGEIKTPYNKQKLVEDLGGFLHKKNVRENIVLFLDDMDIEIISTVWNIPDVSQDTIVEFFKGKYSFSVLYERFLNLEERLILYRKAGRYGEPAEMGVNPLLEDILKPYISVRQLLQKPVYAEYEEKIKDPLSVQMLGAFISYIAAHPDLCKADGSFKKKTVADFKEIFPGLLKRLHCLISGFRNLMLLKDSESGTFLDYKKFEKFTELPQEMQYAYLCASSAGRLSRDELRREAQLLLDTIAAIPQTGYTFETLVRAAYLISIKSIGNDSQSLTGKGRFSKMLESRKGLANSDTETGHLSHKKNSLVSRMDVIDRLFESAVELGILQVAGKTADNSKILAVTYCFNSDSISHKSKESLLNIDAGFSITLLPGLSLADILPLTNFMNIVRYDTAAQYEITKKSALRAFDHGFSDFQLFDLIEQYCSYPIPQNFKISIEEWYKAYTSAIIYKGYVLKIDPENTLLTEKNPLLKPYIYKTLAPGVYLLTSTNDSQITELIEKNSLDFIGSIQTVKKDVLVSGFAPLAAGMNYLTNETGSSVSSIDGTEKKISDTESRKAFLTELDTALDSMDLDDMQRECFENRIKRKIILDKIQLRTGSVHTEIVEARGMDFLGKVRVIERAISSGNMIKINYDSDTDDRNKPAVEFFGKPLEIKKSEADAAVMLQLEPDQTVRMFSIGQAASIKRIRGSLFTELTSEE
jgi:hypothetical protein